ncbi:MAG: ABC transporter permease [Acidobacteriota bacterium]|nr:ABC transporter permease [Acidobacteriota bacterium]
MRKSIPGRHFAKNLIERRSLIFQLVKRDFQQRYIGSAAGWLWGLIHPLVLLGIYTFIFGVCLRTPLGPGEVTSNYSLFLLSGMLPWLLFQETVQRSSGSIVEQSNLITKTMFPSEIVPVSIFLSSLISHLLAVGLFVAVVAITERQLPGPAFALLPVGMLLIGLFAVGMGWIVAALQVYLRDTAQIVIVALTLWYWITPIVITEATFRSSPYGEAARFVLSFNPLVYIVRTYRQMLLGHSFPWQDIGMAAGFGTAAFLVGGLFFRKLKRGFADVL